MAKLNFCFWPIPLKNSLAASRLIFAKLNLQGSNLIRSRRERAARLLSENFGVCRDPFVSKMRNVVQRASKISRRAQTRVFQQYWPEADGAPGHSTR
jgi:hypothetical protein